MRTNIHESLRTLSARVRRAPAWAIQNPLHAFLYVLLATAVFAVVAPITSRAANRTALALWPPSLAGSWYDRTDPGFSVTLTQTGGRVSGTGSVNGNGFSVVGTGGGRTADLEVKYAGREMGVIATMPDRGTLMLTIPSIYGRRTLKRR